MVKKQFKTSMSTMRWFRRSNVYIAEYILMLVVVGALLGVLSSLYFSTLQLTYTDGYKAQQLVHAVTSQLSMLIIVAPAAYWLYSRVTGQEMMQPELFKNKARTVFLTLWMIPVASVFLGVSVSIVHAILRMIVDQSSDVLSLVIGTILPGILALGTIGFGLFMVVKQVNRKLTMLNGMVLAIIVAIVTVTSLVLVFMNRDSDTSKTNNCDYGSLQTFRTCDDVQPLPLNNNPNHSKSLYPSKDYPSTKQ